MMRRFDQINVIPFIDIMLVLLAIVLTTATFISQGRMDIDVPIATNNLPPPDNKQQIHISVDKDGIISYQQSPVSLQELEKQIVGIDKNTKIILSIDKTVLFQQFVDVVDLLKQQEIKQLSIITKKNR